MSNDVVLSRIDGSLATVTLNRPEKRNAINAEVLEGLEKTFGELALNGAVHSIVLRGEGVCFSAGIDLNYLAGLSAVEQSQLGVHVRYLAHRVQSVMNVVENIEKPVIAKLHGFVGGLALELAMACDFRIGTRTSTYGVPEMVLGLVPDCGGTTRLTRSLGIARAKELVMLGEMIDADRAERFGILNRVFDEGEFEKGFDEFVAKVLDRPGLGMGLAKRLIDIGAGTDRMTFMDLEATFQSILITAKDFPETFSNGIAKLMSMKKKA